jgi:hypothetical protein
MSLVIKQVMLSILLLTVFRSTDLLAHGEDKPGPNGGFIQMPGGFHTEVVPAGKNNIKVYLLDLDWKNPITKDSSVVAILKKGKQTERANCKSETNYFSCFFSAQADLKAKASLEIFATRDKQAANVAVYELPLKLNAKSQNMNMGHGSH